MPSVEGNMIMVNVRTMSRLTVVIVGEYSAAFGEFQVQKEGREAQIYKITHHVCYAEAARQIGGTIRQNDGDNRGSTGRSGHTVGNVAYASPDMVTRPVQWTLWQLIRLTLWPSLERLST